MKIVSIIGTRPQFVKIAPVALEFAKHAQLEHLLVHTGQHFDPNMSDIFFNELFLPEPQYHLNVIEIQHGKQIAQMLEKIESVLIQEKPHFVLVYGDTNSTLAGAIAAFKLNIPVIHIEAGLRSNNRSMPEEQNRILADHASSYLFAPSVIACENLKKEGISPEKIVLGGDIMLDSFLYFSERLPHSILEKYHLKSKKYILATIHRAENTNDGMQLLRILNFLNALGQSIQVFYPIHPRTQKFLANYSLSYEQFENIYFTEPLGYLEMLSLQKDAFGIVTDSGGIQKEAYYSGVPCATLREETEWVETVQSGGNKLLPMSKNPIPEDVLDFINNCSFSNEKYYGEGDASQKLAQLIQLHLKTNV